jgi:hypothetical protein
MKTEIKKFKDAIESIYDSPGYFTKKQRIKMKKLKGQRERVYDELAKITSDALSKVMFTIETGFYNIWSDKKPMQDHQKLFRKAKSNIRKEIDNTVNKANKKLAAKDPYFELFPISIAVKIMPHQLDYPTKKSTPRENRSLLITDLSNSLKSHLPKKADREKFISNILQFFYGFSNEDAKPRNIRRHL